MRPLQSDEDSARLDRELELGMAEAMRLIDDPPADETERNRRRFNLETYWRSRSERAR